MHRRPRIQVSEQYFNISRLPHRRLDRYILHRLHTITVDRNAHFFTPDMTAEAIKTTKNSRSTCPDGISYLHLKHFSPHAIRALTNTFYHSLDTNSIPSIWEMGQKHPYPQHNKPPNETTTYRPIALLCSPSKILERLELNNINPKSSYLLHNMVSGHTTLLAHISQT